MPSRHLNAGVALTDRAVPRVGDPIADLKGLAAEQWEEIDPPARADLIQGLDARYKTYVTNFYTLADTCVVRHDYFIRRHRTWRYVAIIGTGLLACMNFLAAKQSIAKAWSSTLPNRRFAWGATALGAGEPGNVR
ncbi:hypothetical protein BH10ACI4_BH10ACI4_30910 [soil metagenome]